jgi:hypothetical protein
MLATSASAMERAGEAVAGAQGLWSQGLLLWRPAALEACFSLALPKPTP